ncbi:MAG: hypothetical protein AB7G93_10725 [Bdellovibrionales bacterium]
MEKLRDPEFASANPERNSLSDPEGQVPLRFSKSGNPTIEKAYRTHYVSKKLKAKSETKKIERSEPDPSADPGKVRYRGRSRIAEPLYNRVFLKHLFAVV